MQTIRMENKLQRFLQSITLLGVMLVLLMGAGVCLLKYGGKTVPYLLLCAAVLAVVGAVVWLTGTRKWPGLVLVAALALFTRLGMVLLWNLAPQNDFLSTYEIALRLAKVPFSQWTAVMAEWGELYREYWCVHVPFIVSEALIMKCFGASYYSIQIVFALFSAGTCVLSYCIAEKLFGRSAGTAAGLLCVLTPTSLFFTSVLSNQHMATFFCALALYAELCRPFRRQIYNGILTGTLLFFSQLARPEMYVGLAAVVCYEVYLIIAGWKKKKGGRLITCALQRTAGMLAAFFVLLLAVDFLLQGSGMIRGSMLEGNLSYKVAVGLNQESQGEWNASDAEVSNDTQELSRRIAERLSSPADVGKLMLKKEGALFGGYDYGWCTDGKSGRIADQFFPLVSEAYMALVLLLCAAACVRGFLRESKGEMLLWLFLLGYILIFAVIEVQNRYNYLFLFVFSILAANGLPKMGKRKKSKNFKKVVDKSQN